LFWFAIRCINSVCLFEFSFGPLPCIQIKFGNKNHLYLAYCVVVEMESKHTSYAGPWPVFKAVNSTYLMFLTISDTTTRSPMPLEFLIYKGTQNELIYFKILSILCLSITGPQTKCAFNSLLLCCRWQLAIAYEPYLNTFRTRQKQTPDKQTEMTRHNPYRYLIEWELDRSADKDYFQNNIENNPSSGGFKYHR